MTSVLKQSLYRHPGIEIRKSDRNGWGVFARRDIKKHSLLEESPIILVESEKMVGIDECLTYCYDFSDGYVMIGLGFAGPHKNIDPPIVSPIPRVYNIMNLIIGPLFLNLPIQKTLTSLH